MSVERGDEVEAETILVRYWAGARAAAGVDHDVFEVVGPLTLADVVCRVLAAHPAQTVEPTIRACSVLVGDRPVSSQDAAQVQVLPGSTVEFLPPFAGG